MAWKKQYKSYKKTKLVWIPEIPDGWHIRKLTHAIAYTVGFTPESGNSAFYGDEFAWANISDLGPRVLIETSKGITEEAVKKYRKKPALAGSLLYSFKLSVGQVSFAGREMFTNEAIASFSESEWIRLSYFYYMAPLAIIQNASENIYGAKILNQEAIGSAKLIIPPIAEQEAIARFLDFKTAQIDSLLAKKQTLLEKLAEERSSFIALAVTKGLDSMAPKKDSKVSWLGDIPMHWKTMRLRFLASMAGGMTPSTGKPEYWGGDIPWITPKDMKCESIDRSLDTLTEQALRETGLEMHDPNSVLIVVRGMILAHTFPVAVNIVPATVNQDMKVLSTTFHYEYFAMLLRGIEKLVLSLVEESAHGTKILRTDVFRNIRLPVPPMNEQVEIVERVRDWTARHDKLEDAVHSVIDRLKQYRASLIANAVTGRIDVRDLQISMIAGDA